jgi:hypothetical protein
VRDHDVVTIAWKFLDERSRGVFSGFRWPVPIDDRDPGAWVGGGDVVACERGIHACDVSDLAWWMSAQLWQIELDEATAVDGHKLVATRGRLVRLVNEWPGAGDDLAEWAVWQVHRHAVHALASLGDGDGAARLAGSATLDDAGETATADARPPDTPAGVAIAQLIDAIDDRLNPVLACWDAARAAGHSASVTNRSIDAYQRAFAAERLAQSRWIARRLQLAA